MTGQAGKVARGLRTIGANVTQLAQNAKEFDITVNGATKTIQLWNDEGTDMLNTYDVLKQISEVWDDMTNAEKASLAVDLAKKTQMDTFLAVMGNFDDAEKAYTTSLLAEGSALEENAKYMESIEAHQKKLQQAWSELVLSAPFEELEKTLLDVGTAILKFANSDIGQTIIQITALITVMALANSALKGFMLLAQEPSAGVLLKTIASLITGETTLAAVTETLTTALLSNPLFWGAAAIAGTILIVKAVEALTVTFEEQIEVLQTYNQAVKDSESECQNLIKKLDELQEQIKSVEDKKIGITDSDDIDALNEEKAVLQEQEALLKSQIALKEAQLKLDREKAKTQAEKIQNTGVEYVATVDNPNAWNTGEKERRFGEVGEALKASIPIVEEYRQKVQELEKQMNSYQTEEELASDEAKATAEELQSTREEYVEMQEVMNDYASDIIDVKMAGIDLTKANQEGYEAWEQYQDQLRNTDEDSQNLLGQIESMTDSMEDVSDATKDTNGIFSDFFDNVEGLQSAYETLTKAADEYNKNGVITASTLKKLNKLEPEYLASLYKEGDMYTNISNDLNVYLDKEKADAKIKIEIARVTALLEIAQNKLNGETDKSKTAIDNFATAASGASDDVAQLKNLTAQLAINMGAIRNQGKVDEDLVSQLQDANAFFDGLSESIDKVNLGAVESSKSAASSSKDAWVEAFEEEQRNLNTLLK